MEPEPLEHSLSDGESDADDLNYIVYASEVFCELTVALLIDVQFAKNHAYLVHA